MLAATTILVIGRWRFDHGCVQPLPNQSEHSTSGDSLPYSGDELVVGNGVKVIRQVCVVDRLAAFLVTALDALDGIMRTVPRPEALGAVLKVGLEDRP